MVSIERIYYILHYNNLPDCPVFITLNKKAEQVKCTCGTKKAKNGKFFIFNDLTNCK